MIAIASTSLTLSLPITEISRNESAGSRKAQTSSAAIGEPALVSSPVFSLPGYPGAVVIRR